MSPSNLPSRADGSKNLHAIAVQAAERAREASRQLEADYRSGKRMRPGWIDVPAEPAKPGEVQVLSRSVYVGPTLTDFDS